MYVPSSELGLSQPLSRQRVCPSPQNPGGGHTRLRVRDWGSPNSDDWKKSSALGCPRNKQKKSPTETNRSKICFSFVSVYFMKQKTKNIGLFQFVSVFGTYIETNRTALKQTKTTPYFHKNTKICSLSNCFGWSSVCFGSIKTSKLSVSV